MNRFKFLSVFLLTSLILLTSVFFTGCENGSAQTSTKLPSAPSKVYTTEELQNLMFRNGINTGTFLLADKNYVLTTREWIRADFSRGLTAFQFQMGIDKWVAETNDCDKFATAATFYAKWLSHSSPNRNVRASLAFGELHYSRESDGRAHAINFFIVNEGELKLVFYEPQNHKIVNLTKGEQFSVFFWRL